MAPRRRHKARSIPVSSEQYRFLGPFYWHPKDDNTVSVRGLRISDGTGWVFIPDTALLPLANDIADYIESHNA